MFEHYPIKVGDLYSTFTASSEACQSVHARIVGVVISPVPRSLSGTDCGAKTGQFAGWSNISIIEALLVPGNLGDVVLIAHLCRNRCSRGDIDRHTFFG
jgi:hypothetical protein